MYFSLSLFGSQLSDLVNVFQFVIENGVLPYLHQLLTQNYKKSIKKEACWTISNITAGNRTQIQVFLEVYFPLFFAGAYVCAASNRVPTVQVAFHLSVL